MENIVIAGFKGGNGKSTIANFLGEFLKNSLIVSLDYKQDAEDYNSSKTINLPKVINMTNINSFASTIQNVNYFIVDTGRLNYKELIDIDIDLLILPTKSGYKSIKTTIDSAMTFAPINTPLMFILNDYRSEKEMNETLEVLESILKISDLKLNNLYFFGIPYSAGIKSSENKKASLQELANQNKLMKKVYSKIITNFIELADEVKKILQPINESKIYDKTKRESGAEQIFIAKSRKAKTKQIQMRCTNEEFKKLEKYSQENDLTMSDVIRLALLRKNML